LLKVITTNKFEKELELAKRRGKSMEKIRVIIEALKNEEPLAEKHKPHRLSGKWSTAYECHIEPDWLLIYRIGEGTLELARTGSHSDLF
jgi:mRNA interferase YafQ